MHSGHPFALPSPSPDDSFLASRDPAIDWQTAQQHGLFQVAADLIRDHARFLAAGAGGKVVVLEEWREGRA